MLVLWMSLFLSTRNWELGIGNVRCQTYNIEIAPPFVFPNYQYNNLTVVTAVTNDPPYIIVSSVSGLPISGFIYNLQAAVAARGQFEFNYIPVDGPTGSYTQWLLGLFDQVDLIDDWYADTPARRNLGLRFANEIVDASVIVVAPQSKPPKSNDWSLFAPFDWDLWAAILAVNIINGFNHWMVDTEDNIFHCLYLSFGQFATVESMAPAKPMGRILNIGYSFFNLMIVASYTANLASFLISSSTSQVLFTSLDDANTHRLPVCAQGGTYAAYVLQTFYPLVPAVIVPSGPDSVQAMLNVMAAGQCRASVLQQVEWDLIQNNVKSNCNIAKVGGSVRTLSGSIAYKHDFFEKCTSFIEEVINRILADMRADGSFHLLWAKAKTAAATIQCPAPQSHSLSLSLGISEMKGLFYIYFIFYGAALTLGVYHLLLKFSVSNGCISPDRFGTTKCTERFRSKRVHPEVGNKNSDNFLHWSASLDKHLLQQFELNTTINFDSVAATVNNAAKMMNMVDYVSASDCQDRWGELCTEQHRAHKRLTTKKHATSIAWQDTLDVVLRQSVALESNSTTDFGKISEKMQLAFVMEKCLESPGQSTCTKDSVVGAHYFTADACERRWTRIQGDVAQADTSAYIINIGLRYARKQRRIAEKIKKKSTAVSDPTTQMNKLHVGDRVKVNLHGFYLTGTVTAMQHKNKVLVDFGDCSEVFNAADCKSLTRSVQFR